MGIYIGFWFDAFATGCFHGGCLEVCKYEMSVGNSLCFHRCAFTGVIICILLAEMHQVEAVLLI